MNDMSLHEALLNDLSEARLFGHMECLFPILRSITGKGIRKTLDYVSSEVKDFRIVTVASGTPVLDWEIPDEWNVSKATIKRCSGETIVDMAQCNLHVLQYSTPFRGRISRGELDKHLFSLPDQPDLVPYRTSYYKKEWGFCISENQRKALVDPEYDVEIDSTLAPGHLAYGEVVIPGRSEEEIFFSLHCCHPSLANDNLSSLAIALELIKALQNVPLLHFSYRFVFVPGTIGAIAWLARNVATTKKIRAGLVLSCLGDEGGLTYKKSRQSDSSINRYAETLIARIPGARVRDFEPYGYDERQYCSPGFNLPVGCLMRSPNGTFPEYHTSADNLEFVKAESLKASYVFIADLVSVMETDVCPISRYPFGEPQLGRRGLYPLPAMSPEPGMGSDDVPDQMCVLWVLNLADGAHSVLDIAERSGKTFHAVARAVRMLVRAGLLDAEWTGGKT